MAAAVGLAGALNTAAAGVTGAPAAPLRDFGFDWVTIGHVGNRAVNLQEGFDELDFRDFGEKNPSRSVGRGGVDHAYRSTNSSKAPSTTPTDLAQALKAIGATPTAATSRSFQAGQASRAQRQSQGSQATRWASSPSARTRAFSRPLACSTCREAGTK